MWRWEGIEKEQESSSSEFKVLSHLVYLQVDKSSKKRGHKISGYMEVTAGRNIKEIENTYIIYILYKYKINIKNKKEVQKI